MVKKHCKHEESRVFNSRVRDGMVWRRRECKACLHRWSTIEIEVADDARTGERRSHVARLREKFGLTMRQQDAIGELIDAFLQPEN